MKKTSKKGRAIRIQFGVLPYRIAEDGSPEYLLVTTRQSRRWIIPKGGPIKGLKPAKSAAREAFEEAGVRGIVAGKAIGSYCFDKTVTPPNAAPVPCEVQVFPLMVTRQHKTWPESQERQCRWFKHDDALAELRDEGLRRIVIQFSAAIARRQKNPHRPRRARMQQYVMARRRAFTTIGRIVPQSSKMVRAHLDHVLRADYAAEATHRTDLLLFGIIKGSGN